jgi:molybdopterin-guanine dinucleotide biosynthesis protein A
VAALRHARAAVVAVGCDMPFVSPGLLACLAREGAGGDRQPDAVAAEVDGVVQPLPALYGPGSLAGLERALASERSLRATLEELDLRVLGEGRMRALGEPRRLFFSVNDRAAVERAARLLASTSAPAG